MTMPFARFSSLSCFFDPATRRQRDAGNAAAEVLLDEAGDHERENAYLKQEDEEIRLELVFVVQRGRKSGNNPDHDDQGDAVADAPLGDRLTHPHEQGGARGQREHDQGEEVLPREGVEVIAEEAPRLDADDTVRPAREIEVVEADGYDAMVAGLETVGQELGMEISVRLYSVYEAMHRI